jgi:hypothetical protein
VPKVSEGSRRNKLDEDSKPQSLSKLVGDEIGADLDAENNFTKRVHEQHLLKFMLMRPDVVVPTNRPVHPFPDLETYVPEEYY